MCQPGLASVARYRRLDVAASVNIDCMRHAVAAFPYPAVLPVSYIRMLDAGHLPVRTLCQARFQPRTAWLGPTMNASLDQLIAVAHSWLLPSPLAEVLVSCAFRPWNTVDHAQQIGAAHCRTGRIAHSDGGCRTYPGHHPSMVWWIGTGADDLRAWKERIRAVVYSLGLPPVRSTKGQLGLRER